MVKYAIVAKDNNPLYDGFWDLVKYCWKEFIGATPVLVQIDRDFDIIVNPDSIVISLPRVDTVDTGLQAQISRMWATKFFPDSSCIISDIDMLNFDRDYYQNKECGQNEMIIYSSDHAGDSRYPMCYVQAYGSTFSKVLDLDCDWPDFVVRLQKLNADWSTDEIYLTNMINGYHDQSIMTKLKRGWNSNIADRRIDRVTINVDTDPYNYKNIAQYIDFHCPRPLEDWREFIETIIGYKKDEQS